MVALRLVALAITGREVAPLLDGLREAAEKAKGTNAALGELVLPLAEALARLLREGDSRAMADILALKSYGGKSYWAPIAGRVEQRGFLLELAAGPVHGGRPIAQSAVDVL